MDDACIDMLEAAFPYLSRDLKRPVAGILKFQELQKVMHDYDTEEMISACSLDSSKINIEQMLLAMKARAAPEAARQIDTMLNAMKMLRIYQNYQDLIGNMPAPLSEPLEKASEPDPEPSSSSNDMLSSLLNDLIQKNNRGET